MPIVRLQTRFIALLIFTACGAILAHAASNFQVIAYYTAPDAYSPRTIATSGAADRITQINFAFGKISNGRCALENPERDILHAYSATESVDGTADPTAPGVHQIRGVFHQLQELKTKYPGIKVVISIGGWGGSGGFSQASDAVHRTAFVASCVQTFIKGNFAPGISAPGVFDGIDIDWEYPVSGGLQKGKPSDKQNFNALLAELRRQMNQVRPGLIVSAALPAGEEDFTNFDLKQVGRLADQIQLMGYDLHWNTEPITNFHSALHHHPADPSSPALQKHYVDYAVQAFLKAGVPASKIMLGVPFYGKGYFPVEDTNHGLFEPSFGPAKDEGQYRKLKALPADADRQFNSEAGSCTVWYENTFWSYDCPDALRAKREYALKNGLGGIMFWELSGDSEDLDLLKVVAGK